MRRAGGASADGLYRYLVELDRRPALGRAGIHGVERLVAAAHRFLALEERDAEALTALAVDEHQHLRAFEAGRCVAGLDLGPNRADRVVDVGGIALECRYACVHVASSCRPGRGEPTRTGAQGRGMRAGLRLGACGGGRTDRVARCWSPSLRSLVLRVSWSFCSEAMCPRGNWSSWRWPV